MLATIKNADLGGVTPPSNLEALRERGADLEAKRRSSATRKVYAREIAAFDAWTAANGFPSDPGDPVAVYGYLAHLADRKALATIRKVAACLSSIAKERGHVSPLKNDRIAGLLSGLRRETAEKGIRQGERAAIPLDDLRTMLATLDLTTLTGQRDAAILLLGFTGAMRRSEIVALNLEDLRFAPEGATIEIRLSKSDQTGEGATVAIPFGSTLATCPVRNLKAWIDASKDLTPEIEGDETHSNPLFRSIDRHGNLGGRLSDKGIAIIVKRTAKAAGFEVDHISAHSLRAGCATQAAKRGIGSEGIKRLGRWKSQVFQRYIRFATVWEDAPAARLGL